LFPGYFARFLFFYNTITISLQIIVVRITTDDLGLGFRKRKIVTSEGNLERLEGGHIRIFQARTEKMHCNCDL